jgi:RNA polymerase sigma-70 factor (ECF subfamily)
VTRKSYKNLPDEELVALAREGNTPAFTELVKRYEETVFRFSFKVCRDRAKAEETMQDTFINVFRKLGSFDGKSKFSTWLFTIVTNNCLMKRRKRKMDSLEESLAAYDTPTDHPDGKRQAELACTDVTPVDAVIDRELREALEQAIRKLPETYRVVFVMRDMEGRSNEETARILNLTVEATKSRLRRARAFLRDQLHPYVTSPDEVAA